MHERAEWHTGHGCVNNSVIITLYSSLYKFLPPVICSLVDLIGKHINIPIQVVDSMPHSVSICSPVDPLIRQQVRLHRMHRTGLIPELLHREACSQTGSRKYHLEILAIPLDEYSG